MEKNKKNLYNYELSFWLSSELDEKQVETKFNSLLKEIEKTGAIINVSQLPQLKPLGYTIKKNKKAYQNAYFSFVQFSLEAKIINTLQKKLKFDDDIIRFFLIRKEIKQTIKISSATLKKSLLKSKKDLPKKRIEELKDVPKREQPSKSISLEELDKKLNEILEK